MPKNRLSPATKIAQALRYLDEETGAVIPSIQPSSTYARDANYEVKKPYWYRRDGNETTAQAEAIIADLEEAKTSLLFSSGMSAASAIIDALPAGTHVVLPKVMYHGVLLQFQRFADQNRLTIASYDAGDLDSLAAAITVKKPDIIWVETPNNPDWAVTDISAAAKLAHDAGAILITDCTATPPCATRALEFGADISFHSATKYLNGHSDASAGVLSTNEISSFWSEIELTRKLHGTVLNSFDAWLLIRGMRTLFLRYERATQSALVLAQHLDAHPKVKTVYYPGLESHPNHEVAKRQTGGQYGGMLSIIVEGGQEAAINLCKAVELFYPATSLGGVESLIEHRATVSGDGFPVDPALLRLSIGIEAVEDLIADLDQALARI